MLVRLLPSSQPIISTLICRGRKVLENRNINAEETIGQLEKELEEAILLGEEADRKYEEVKMATALLDCLLVSKPAHYPRAL